MFSSIRRSIFHVHIFAAEAVVIISQTVHSFVASRIDYCNAVLAGAPKATTNKLQRVLNAAARVVSVPLTTRQASVELMGTP